MRNHDDKGLWAIRYAAGLSRFAWSRQGVSIRPDFDPYRKERQMKEAELERAVLSAARDLIMWPGDDDKPGIDDDEEVWLSDGEMKRYNILAEAVLALIKRGRT